jgi:hypothetical protein
MTRETYGVRNPGLPIREEQLQGSITYMFPVVFTWTVITTPVLIVLTTIMVMTLMN